MLRLRTGDKAFLSDVIDSLPAQSPATPYQLTYKLAWRGSVHAHWGNTALARADLLEVTARIRSGLADNSDGVYNGLLAFAHWQSGAWNLARLEMGLALECAVGQPHPMNRAIEPMLLAGRGDFEQADRKLRESEDVLGAMPWRVAMESEHVASDLMERLSGRSASMFLSLLIMWTAVAGCFAALLGYSRIPYAAARSGH